MDKKTLDEKNQIKKEAVLLNSGGIDSRVTAKMMSDAGYILHSIFINANKHNSEVTMPAAEETAKLYCVDHFVFEYPKEADWYFEKQKDWFGVPFTFLYTHALASHHR